MGKGVGLVDSLLLWQYLHAWQTGRSLGSQTVISGFGFLSTCFSYSMGLASQQRKSMSPALRMID